MVPWAAILPRYTMAIRSHITSAISIVWVLMSTVPPRLTNSRNRSLSRRALLGSRPTIGSSTMMTSGRCTSAPAMMSFCRMPWLYVSVSSPFQGASSNTVSSSSMRRSTTGPCMPYSAAAKRRNSPPVSLS